ncbi:MAG: hypothetical protein P1U38_03000 [Aeromicrobium sp.]|uniref:hypothetical protein n=1 Tax=Aeromicrobium sp. TaxID=1871063 RepID=UPI0025C00985|nr:hypothetical protein [Aeromicrobium sp.]MCK5890234.1 hypothetical protein [Aeromicrobium sp.]MDF1703720.1 hypothetical protein [Aeromicrobium sp.]
MASAGPVAVDRAGPRDVGSAAAFSVVAGLASAIPIGRASRRARRLVAGASAVVAGAAAARLTAAAASAEREAAADGPAPPPTARQGVGPAVAGAVAAGATAGTVLASIAMDRRFEAFLGRRGVRRPRLVIGVVAGLGSFAMDRLEGLVEPPQRGR